MHGLALQLLARPEIYSVSTDIDRMNGSHVKCAMRLSRRRALRRLRRIIGLRVGAGAGGERGAVGSRR